MTKIRISKFTVVFALLLIFNFSYAQEAYRVDQIPDPKKSDGGYVSNPDNILQASEVSSINETILNFEQKTNVEVAVVVVRDFDKNQEDFDFAYALFQHWGIGKKESNNGLLLFIATDRRKYRFITGTGVEGVLPDITLRHIAQKQLIPAFRENNYAVGIERTLDDIGKVILNPQYREELNQQFTQKSNSDFWETSGFPTIGIIALFLLCKYLIRRRTPKLNKTNERKKSSFDKPVLQGCGFMIFIVLSVLTVAAIFGFFKDLFKIAYFPYYAAIFSSCSLFVQYTQALAKIRKTYYDNENFICAVTKFNKSLWWITFVSPLTFIPLSQLRQMKKSFLPRFVPILDENGEAMERVDRDKNRSGKPYLNAGQQKEEYLESAFYDIWLGKNKTVKLIAHEGEKLAKYESCPSCGFKTFTLPRIKVITKATYKREGTGKEIQNCKNCGIEHFLREVAIPVLVVSSSDSSSSGSGSSSSSSSSSDWGGGSSSGGGDGGSW